MEDYYLAEERISRPSEKKWTIEDLNSDKDI